MKKIKFQKKLSLKKETIAKLNDDQMNQVKGGLNDKNGDPRSLNTSCTIWACETALSCHNKERIRPSDDQFKPKFTIR